MGSLLITSLVALHLIFSPSLIVAATSTASPRGQSVREQVRVRNEEKRATREARLAEIRRERIQKFFNRLVRRLEAAIGRLERLITRIESRIAKIEEKNKDINTGPIKEQVENAKSKLQNAKKELQEAKDNFAALLTSDEPKVVFEGVRDNIRNIKKDLVEVHRILVHAIGDIKGLRIGKTSSPSPSPTP